MADPPKRRMRQSRPKVRTGCVTCKLRRVKCDEGKPACMRCTTTGRKCDGYGMQTFTLAVSREPSLGGATSAVQNAMESAALEFFYRRTSPQLSVFFGHAFWKNCVVHSSLTDPAIRHAVGAIGALHKAQVSATSSECCQQTVSAALVLYNKAIHSIVKKTSEEPRGLISAVIGSVIFTCFEFLRGDISTAAMHIANGMRLLLRQRQDHAKLEYSSFETAFLEHELAPILGSFHISTSELSRTTDPQHKYSELFVVSPMDQDGMPLLPESLKAIPEAQSTLIDLILIGHQLLTPAILTTSPGPPPQLVHKLCYCNHLLSRWKEQFDELFQLQSRSWNSEEVNTADFLRVMWYAAKTTLSGCFSNTEMAWDASKADFEEMLSISESLLHRPRPFSGDWDFSCELGVLTPLYTVAWKCRYPLLRRRALDLVLLSPKREILYDSAVYHAIYTRIMQVEESAAGLPPGAVPDENWLPPEDARVQHFFGKPVDGGGRRGYNMRFLMKGQSPTGGWRERTEYLDLQNLQGLSPSRGWQFMGGEKPGLPVLNLIWTKTEEWNKPVRQ